VEPPVESSFNHQKEDGHSDSQCQAVRFQRESKNVEDNRGAQEGPGNSSDQARTSNPRVTCWGAVRKW